METFINNYLGFGIHPSKCKVYINHIDDIHYFCFEDMGDGTSVTNASEAIATDMIEKFNLNPEKCRFFERYVYGNDITFDKIEYTWVNRKASSPTWKPGTAFHAFGFEDDK